MIMNKLAYDNLKLLNKEYSDNLFLISDHNILSLIEKDNFDTCSKIKSLEYPIYFTFHHILNIIDYDKDISYKSKMNLLDMINNSLNNLLLYIDDYNDNDNDNDNDNNNNDNDKYEEKNENENIIIMIDNIYERFDNVKLNTKHNYFERIVYLFDEIVDGFRTAEKYLYHSPLSYYPLMNIKAGNFIDDEGEYDTEDDNSEEDNSEEDNSEEDNSEEDNSEEDNSNKKEGKLD